MIRLEKILLPVGGLIAVVAFGVLVSVALEPTVKPGENVKNVVSSYSVKPLTFKLVKELDRTIAEKIVRVSGDALGKSANSSNGDFVALKDAVAAAAKTARDLTTIIPFRQLSINGSIYTSEYRAWLTKDVEYEKELRIKKLEAAVVQLENAIPGENAAIEAAEAEAARVAEEESSSNYYSGSDGGGNEDLNSRVSRIFGSLPFYLSYSIEGCPGGALACYTYTTHYLKVSTNISGYSDCTLRNALAHEYRHYIQDISGWFAFDSNGQLTNRDWLESDAYAFGDSYGC